MCPVVMYKVTSQPGLTASTWGLSSQKELAVELGQALCWVLEIWA